jgi:hydroxyethylthiazole kinase-like uncharacterized protein yjeF
VVKWGLNRLIVVHSRVLRTGIFPVNYPLLHYGRSIRGGDHINVSSAGYFSAAQLREIDRIAIEDFGIDGFELMTRAARGAFESMMAFWPGTRAVHVYCGTGNNGGDGLVLAGLAREAGLQADVVICGDRNKIRGTALQALSFAEKRGVRIHENRTGVVEPKQDKHCVVVDALLGTGTVGQPGAALVPVITAINQGLAPVLALDLPSGLDADTGATPGVCVKAALTVTFIGMKNGFRNPNTSHYCGKIILESLGLPAAVYSQAAMQQQAP